MISATRTRNWSVCLLSAASALCLLTAGAAFFRGVRDAHALPFAVTNTLDKGGKDTSERECLECHRGLVEHYQDTAHARTSRPARSDTVLGYVQAGGDGPVIEEAASANAVLSFHIIKRDGKFRQSVGREAPNLKEFRSEPIDEVVGSGKRGQTYLYWRQNSLFELPLSWWRDGNRWINSPGYADGTANFTRPVITRCIECHANSIQASSPAALNNRFERSSLWYGISCVRCHGDGRAHTLAERNAISSGAGRAPMSLILNPRNFSRDRQVDLCALCHSGQREQVQPAFTHKPGEPLDRYLRPSTLTAVPDVHGNQVGLLERSACYRSSPGMTCSTCHEVHAPGQPAESYNSRCLACHQAEACGKYASLGNGIVNRCIGCHMPVQATQSIVSQTAGETIRAQIRTHWIRVYPP